MPTSPARISVFSGPSEFDRRLSVYSQHAWQPGVDSDAIEGPTIVELQMDSINGSTLGTETQTAEMDILVTSNESFTESPPIKPKNHENRDQNSNSDDQQRRSVTSRRRRLNGVAKRSNRKRLSDRQTSSCTSQDFPKARPWQQVNQDVSARMMAANTDSPPMIPRRDYEQPRVNAHTELSVGPSEVESVEPVEALSPPVELLGDHYLRQQHQIQEIQDQDVEDAQPVMDGQMVLYDPHQAQQVGSSFHTWGMPFPPPPGMAMPPHFVTEPTDATVPYTGFPPHGPPGFGMPPPPQFFGGPMFPPPMSKKDAKKLRKAQEKGQIPPGMMPPGPGMCPMPPPHMMIPPPTIRDREGNPMPLIPAAILIAGVILGVVLGLTLVEGNEPVLDDDFSQN